MAQSISPPELCLALIATGWLVFSVAGVAQQWWRHRGRRIL